MYVKKINEIHLSLEKKKTYMFWQFDGSSYYNLFLGSFRAASCNKWPWYLAVNWITMPFRPGTKERRSGPGIGQSVISSIVSDDLDTEVILTWSYFFSLLLFLTWSTILLLIDFLHLIDLFFSLDWLFFPHLIDYSSLDRLFLTWLTWSTFSSDWLFLTCDTLSGHSFRFLQLKLGT